MLEVSSYTEVDFSRQSDEEDAKSASEDIMPAGSGLLYAQTMLQDALAMTRGHTGRASRRDRGQTVSRNSGGRTSPNLTKCSPFRLATDERCSPRRSDVSPSFSHCQSQYTPRMQEGSPQPGQLMPRPRSCEPKPTRVKPFNLVCVHQHEQHQIKMQLVRQKEEAEARDRRQFKARPYSPLRVRCRTPRSPSTPPKSPTEPAPFNLESPKRHQRYVEYVFPEKLAREEQQRRKEKLAERRKKAQEAADIKKYRETLVFKARPAPNMQYVWVPDLSDVRPGTNIEPFRLTPTFT